MTDKVQKIREEVEKIAKSINPFLPDEDGKNSEYEAGRFAMVTQIMQIIDSLQEEPVSINFEQELYKAFGQVKDFTLGMQIAKWFYNMGKNSQEPVSEEPKYKEGDILYKNDDGSKIEILAIVADQYKFECGDSFPHYEFFEYIESNYSKEPVSEELNEAAIDYAESVDYRGFSNAPWNFVQDVFNAGAKWQKEKDQKK